MASGSTSARSTTIAQERLVNPAALAGDEATFVRQQLAGYTAYPTYYRYMGPINREGPRILGTMPQPPALDAQTVRERLQQGMPLIDGRRREHFANEHIPGSLNIELDSSFATYVGWLLPFNVPLLLLIEDEAGRREAVVQLLRVGYERVQGYLDGGIATWKAAALPTDRFDSIDIATLYQRWSRGEGTTRAARAAKVRPYQDRTQQDRPYLLDVRRPDEWRSGHVPGAQHIHISELPTRMHELPTDEPITVMCHSGQRASIAASMIAASGRPVIAVRGGMGDWLQAGFPRQEEVESSEDYLASITDEQAHQPLSP
jgi:hydroxyacylglutathione hydrolase